MDMVKILWNPVVLLGSVLALMLAGIAVIVYDYIKYPVCPFCAPML